MMIDLKWLEESLAKCKANPSYDNWYSLALVLYSKLETARRETKEAKKLRIEDFTLDEIRSRLWILST